MNGIKDFFYNKNDIIIVLLIIAAAAFVIYERIDAIMQYPQEAAARVEQAQQDADSADTTDEDTAMTSEKMVRLDIEANDRLSDVSRKLEKLGLVSSADKFTDYAMEQHKDGALITGTYSISKDASIEEILDEITR